MCVCVSLPVSQSAGLSVHLRFRGNVGVWWCLMPLFASSSPISRKPNVPHTYLTEVIHTDLDYYIQYLFPLRFEGGTH